jgi:hypothetical protein
VGAGRGGGAQHAGVPRVEGVDLAASPFRLLVEILKSAIGPRLFSDFGVFLDKKYRMDQIPIRNATQTLTATSHIVANPGHQIAAQWVLLRDVFGPYERSLKHYLRRVRDEASSTSRGSV